MESVLRRHIETCALAFASATGRELSTVARLATGDWRFLDRIADGASFTARKYDGIMGWFSTNWPDDQLWPLDVPRPKLSDKPGSHDLAAPAVDDAANLPAACGHGADNPDANISGTGGAA